MKYLSVIILSILLIACSSEAPVKKEKKQVSESNQTNDAQIEETEEVFEDTIVPFELIIPDSALLNSRFKTDYSNSMFYLYLEEYYERTSERKDVENFSFEDMEDEACSYTQTYSNAIEFTTDECGDGGLNQSVSFPRIDHETVKRFIETTFYDPENTWSNTLNYNPDGAGCHYNIKHTELLTTITLYCGC